MPTLIANPLYDNTMASDATGTNYDAITTVDIGESNAGNAIWRGLMKFDYSSIPPRSQILTATLALTVIVDYCTNARTLRVYRCLRDWHRTQSCWQSWKTGFVWATGGADGVIDREAVDVGNIALGAAEVGTKIINLTAASIQTIVDGTFVNNGYVLRVDTETDDGYWYGSLEYATAAYRPLLTVTYISPLGRLPTYIVDGLQGGITLKATVEQFANNVWVRHTPPGGTLTQTYANPQDTASQAKFGQKDQPLQGGSADAVIAKQLADVYLGFQSTPNMPDITLAAGTIIKDQNGNVVPPEEIRPNNWMLIENLALPTSAVFSSLTQNPMALFLEEVAFDDVNGLQITAGRDRFTQALVARIAGRGGG